MRGKETQVQEQCRADGMRTLGEGSSDFLSTKTAGRSLVNWTHTQVKTVQMGAPTRNQRSSLEDYVKTNVVLF